MFETNDTTFILFCIVIPIIAISSYLVIALPLSLLVYFDFSFLKPYYVQQKRRPSRDEVWQMIMQGLRYSLQNHAVLIALLIFGFPLLKPIFCKAFEFPHQSINFYTLAIEPFYNLKICCISILQLIATVYLEDFFYYHLHKFAHTNKFMYKHVHSLHHTVYVPIALSGHYMTVWEFLLIGSTVLVTPILVGLVFYPMQYIVMVCWLCFRQWEAAEEHCGFEIPGIMIMKKIVPFYDGAAYHGKFGSCKNKN